MTIANNSQEQIAFKVKTTAPKFYCVRPNAALLGAGESVQVQVILLGLSKEPEADFKCRDKFLVITLPAPYDLGNEPVANAWPRLETEFKQQAVSKKIKVKYVLDGQPQSEGQEAPVESYPQQQQQQNVQPQHEDEQRGLQPQHAQAEEPELSSPTEVVPPVTAQIDSEKSPVEVETKVKTEVLPQKAAISAPKEPVSAQEGSLNSSALIMIAIIALILGWLYY